MKPIIEIAKRLGIGAQFLELYDKYKAKVSLDTLKKTDRNKSGKYILVTAITPTPLGEGKTVTTIGLTMGLNRIGNTAIVNLRQPSLGPVFGVKGGAAGGNKSMLVPMEDINLHLTGDTHAVGVAHNLAAAFLDNAIFRKTIADIDASSVYFRRVLDISDRTLRGSFDITPSSEVMAALSLATDLADLRKRLGRIVLALTHKGRPVTADTLKVAGSMAALLRDAIKPNLLQTIEGTPAFMHTGPFANIAHGNSSIIADRIALKLADYTVTESGFGADCGAEKFFDIKCRYSGLVPDAAVLVCSVRGIKAHAGYANLKKQIENVKIFGVPVVVAINRFASDTNKDIEAIKKNALLAGADDAVVSTAWKNGSKGAVDLARAVVKAAAKKSHFKFLYPLDMPVTKKIEIIARRIYGAGGVSYSDLAREKIALYEKLGFGRLPICMAKTQLSLSHDPHLKGAPKGYTLPITDARLSAGAGFIYPLCGHIRTMPGLPLHPAGEKIDIDKKGKITGLF